MNLSRTTLALIAIIGILLAAAPPAASQGPPRAGGGPPSGSAPGFSLTQGLDRLGLNQWQLDRIKTLERDMNSKMGSLLEELTECVEDDPYGRKAMELRSRISTVIEECWLAMREVLTEEQLRELFIISPAHPLVQDKAPGFLDAVGAGGGSDTGPRGPGGGPPDRGGW